MTSYSVPCEFLYSTRSAARKWQVEQCLIKIGQFALTGSPVSSNLLFGSTASSSQLFSYETLLDALTSWNREYFEW